MSNSSAAKAIPHPISNLLKTYLAPQKGSVVLLGAFIFANLGLQLLIPQIMRGFIDSVVAGEPLTNLVRLGVIFLLTALGAAGDRCACGLFHAKCRLERHQCPA